MLAALNKETIEAAKQVNYKQKLQLKDQAGENEKARTEVGEAFTLRVRVSSIAGFCCGICGILWLWMRFGFRSRGRFSCTALLFVRWSSLRGQVLALLVSSFWAITKTAGFQIYLLPPQVIL